MKKLILSTAIFAFALAANAQNDNEVAVQKRQHLPDAEILCSPNPVQDQLTVHLDNNSDQTLKWAIADLSGHILTNGTFPAFEQTVQIETGILPKGMFVLMVTTPDGSEAKAIRFVLPK